MAESHRAEWKPKWNNRGKGFPLSSGKSGQNSTPEWKIHRSLKGALSDEFSETRAAELLSLPSVELLRAAVSILREIGSLPAEVSCSMLVEVKQLVGDDWDSIMADPQLLNQWCELLEQSAQINRGLIPVAFCGLAACMGCLKIDLELMAQGDQPAEGTFIGTVPCSPASDGLVLQGCPWCHVSPAARRRMQKTRAAVLEAWVQEPLDRNEQMFKAARQRIEGKAKAERRKAA